MTAVDLGKKNWLIPFIRESFQRFDEDAARAYVASWTSQDAESSYEAWRLATLRRRGIANGPPRRIWPIPEDGIPRKERGEWHFLNALAHQVEVLLELRLLLGLGASSASDQLEVLSVFAAQSGEMNAAESFFELASEDWSSDEDHEKLVKELRDPARTVGKALRKQRLFDYDQPLLGLPLHFILIYSRTKQLLDIAWPYFREEERSYPDEELVESVRAQAAMRKVYLVEAVIAMAQADHRITKVEKRLLENVIEIMQLPKDEEEMLWAQLESPMDVGELGQRLEDPMTRRFIFVQLVLQSLLEGAQDMLEHSFIETFGTALGLSQEQQVRYETEAYAFLEENPDLIDAFELTGVLRRFKNSLGRQYESIIAANLAKIVEEIRQTGELAKLLAKDASSSEELTPEEREKIREQILDILKSIPALGLFAIPGGSLLLPIVMRLLPFDIMPSSFSEADEDLIAASADDEA